MRNFVQRKSPSAPFWEPQFPCHCRYDKCDHIKMQPTFGPFFCHIVCYCRSRNKGVRGPERCHFRLGGENVWRQSSRFFDSENFAGLQHKNQKRRNTFETCIGQVTTLSTRWCKNIFSHFENKVARGAVRVFVPNSPIWTVEVATAVAP